MTKLFLAGALFAQLGLMQMTQAPLPPELPWHGASESLIAGADNPWITPGEANGFTATPTYAETRAWLERIDAASPLIRMEVFGRSPQGRDLLAVFVSEDGAAFDPAKPVLFIQAGIHSGEIDGKDAGLMLLRDIAFGDKRSSIDRVNIVFVPIFNVDGHERAGIYNRPNQRGPSNQGWRNTAQNLNLNRDYTKADAPEMRAMLALLQRVRPDLFLDIHVTDGSDYQYDVTYGYQGAGRTWSASPHISRWLDQHFRPDVDRALARQGHVPGDLVFPLNDLAPDEALAGYAFSPRFSQAYGDMIHMASVLVENHSLKPHRQRVLGTYVLYEASLRLLAEHGASLRTASRQDAAARPRELPVGWRQSERTVQRDYLPVGYERYRSAASGRDEVRYTGRAGAPMRIAVHQVEPTGHITRPRAYWVPATKPEVIALLRTHGIQVETITEARTVHVEMLRLPGATLSAAAAEGRQRASSGDPRRETRDEWMPPGSVRVPTDQPLGDLAMILLDPESEDSLFAWGFFNETLQRVEYVEGYIIAPYADALLQADRALRAEFETRLAADPAFAADPDARLAWFYGRSPYADARYQLYPVGLER
ncbi:M14 family metallopeptidase [Terricaulis sp.]|uniref:M14 family metallopeptidase n=1 Tax=Terricaulis sp. TaxID=2768686 RepID=UPI00378460B3